MKSLLAPSLLLAAGAALATPAGPALSAAATRGERFYHRQFAYNDQMPACTRCHPGNPLNAGRHAVTGKDIRPLAPAANPERLRDAARVEKWFGRNCREVLGRPCTADEKTDFVAYLQELR